MFPDNEETVWTKDARATVVRAIRESTSFGLEEAEKLAQNIERAFVDLVKAK